MKVPAVSPAARDRVPDGSTPPAKSSASVPTLATCQPMLTARLASPARVTLKVIGVVPLWPSSAATTRAATCRVGGATSSLRIVAVAEPVPMEAPPVGLARATWKTSSGSTVRSPRTVTVTVLLVCQAARLTVPEGRTPPVKSAASALPPATCHATLTAGRPSPERVTVKVKGIVPLWPSALAAAAAAIASTGGSASSLRMVPVAVAVARTPSPVGSRRVTLKASWGSTVVSPCTWTVIVFLVCPAPKVNRPEGSTPPAKSARSALSPVTCQSTLTGLRVPPLRVTVKVNGVVPSWPSFRAALAARTASRAGSRSSLRISPEAVPAPIEAPPVGSDRVRLKLSSASSCRSP